jgi:hypothetical protein
MCCSLIAPPLPLRIDDWQAGGNVWGGREYFSSAKAGSSDKRECMHQEEGPAMRINVLIRFATPIALLALAGCMDRATIFDNPDPNLDRPISAFRSDALDRFPYKAEAPKQKEIRARAQVGYPYNRLEVVNFSEQDWENVELWVNRKYVCLIPKMQSRKLKEIHFPTLMDEKGKSFPMNSHKSEDLIRTVEVFRDGKMYQVTVEATDIH